MQDEQAALARRYGNFMPTSVNQYHERIKNYYRTNIRSKAAVAKWGPVRFLKRIAFLGKPKSARFLYEESCSSLDSLALKYFLEVVTDLGGGALLQNPVCLKNPKYFRIGRDFRAGPGLRLEAWDEYAGEHFFPEIKIGDKHDVIIN